MQPKRHHGTTNGGGTRKAISKRRCRVKKKTRKTIVTSERSTNFFWKNCRLKTRNDRFLVHLNYVIDGNSSLRRFYDHYEPVTWQSADTVFIVGKRETAKSQRKTPNPKRTRIVPWRTEAWKTHIRAPNILVKLWYYTRKNVLVMCFEKCRLWSRGPVLQVGFKKRKKNDNKIAWTRISNLLSVVLVRHRYYDIKLCSRRRLWTLTLGPVKSEFYNRMNLIGGVRKKNIIFNCLRISYIDLLVNKWNQIIRS